MAKDDHRLAAENAAVNLFELGRAHGRWWYQDDEYVIVDAARRGCRIVMRYPPDDPVQSARQLLARAEKEMPEAGVLIEDTYGVLSLAPYGFEPMAQMPVMVRPAGPYLGPRSAEISVRPATTSIDLTHAERLTVEEMPMPRLQPFRPGVLFPPDPLSVSGWILWLAWLDGEPVGACATQEEDAMVGLYGMVTHRQYRRRGVARALLAALLDHYGTRPCCLSATDEGFPLYRDNGFRTIGKCIWWRRDGVSR